MERLVVPVKDFLKLESASGILLMIMTCLALIVANSPLQDIYHGILKTPFGIVVGDFELIKPVLLWINDGLMAVFFFLVGLELKREVVQGELSDPKRVTLPLVGAIAGMACPALIYTYFNHADPVAIKGWAIPSATDIAFALGVLSLLGSRVPHTLKLFLLTLAIVDDLGAILVIAIFYTETINVASLVVAAGCLLLLGFLNFRKVTSVSAYIIVGTFLWMAVLKSGVHATIAGVLLAMFIPIKIKDEFSGKSVLEDLEHDLHPTVAFLILPIFAFSNTGLSLSGISLSDLFNPLPLGIILGLFIGNQLGIFTACWITVKLKMASLPEGVSWKHLYGVGILCGVGFTMSLFVSSLAFDSIGYEALALSRLGILVGSLFSAVFGFLWLYFLTKQDQANID